MTEENKTRIVVCKKCGIRTRHEWRQWEHRPLLLRLTGRVRVVEGWACSKCGRRNAVRRVGTTRGS